MASAGTPRSDAAEAAAVLAAFKQSAADTQAFHAANPPHDARHDARTGPRGPSGSLSGPPWVCAGRRPQAARTVRVAPSAIRSSRDRQHRPAPVRSPAPAPPAARSARSPEHVRACKAHCTRTARAARMQRASKPCGVVAAPAAALTTRSMASRGSLRVRKTLLHAASKRARPALLQRPEWFGRRSAARLTGGTVRAVASTCPRGRNACCTRSGWWQESKHAASKLAHPARHDNPHGPDRTAVATSPRSCSCSWLFA